MELSATFGFVLLANLWKPLSSFYIHHPVIPYFAIPIALVVICLIFCYGNRLTSYPANYIAMLFLVAVVSLALGSLVSFVPPETVTSACLCLIGLMFALLANTIRVRGNESRMGERIWTGVGL